MQQSQGVSFINYQLPASSLHPLPHAHHQLRPLAGGPVGTSSHFPEEAAKAREGQADQSLALSRLRICSAANQGIWPSQACLPQTHLGRTPGPRVGKPIPALSPNGT